MIRHEWGHSRVVNGVIESTCNHCAVVRIQRHARARLEYIDPEHGAVTLERPACVFRARPSSSSPTAADLELHGAGRSEP